MFKEQRGLASIVVVSVLIVLITLISLGFARIMNRTIGNSANHAFSSAATYAAQSAINDVGSYLKTNPALPGAADSKCSGGGSLLSGPFANDANLSGDNTTKYTCLLLNETPGDIFYQNIPPNKSKVIRMNTTANPGRLLISWQSYNGSFDQYPPAGNNLLDETTWNSNKYMPMLRLTLYPIPPGGSTANLETDAKTVFLYPRNGGGSIPNPSYSSLQDGDIFNVNCSKNVAGNFNGTADFTCNLIVDNLPAASSPSPSYFYVRMTPLYNSLDIKIKANDTAGSIIYFQNVQALVDVTAQAGPVSKRLQARLDISNTGGTSYDINPSDNAVPEHSIRSAETLCKRFVTGAVLTVDDISGQCAPNITFTIPTVTLTASPTLVPAGATSTLTWTVSNAASCNASAVPAVPAWSGAKNSATTPPDHTQSTGALNSVTTYTFNITCRGSTGATATDSATVTVQATPPPPPGGGGAAECKIDAGPSPNSMDVNQTTTVSVTISHCYNGCVGYGTVSGSIPWPGGSPITGDNIRPTSGSINSGGSGGWGGIDCSNSGNHAYGGIYVNPVPPPPVVCTPCPFGGCAETGCWPPPPCLKGCP